MSNKALTILVFRVLRALFPHFTLATIVDPLGRRAPGSRNLSGTAAKDEIQTKSAPFNKERLDVAKELIEILIVITFGKKASSDSCFDTMKKAYRERLLRLPKLARETDINRCTTQVCPKRFYEGRRVLMGESFTVLYEHRMKLQSEEELKVSAKDRCVEIFSYYIIITL